MQSGQGLQTHAVEADRPSAAAVQFWLPHPYHADRGSPQWVQSLAPGCTWRGTDDIQRRQSVATFLQIEPYDMAVVPHQDISRMLARCLRAAVTING